MLASVRCPAPACGVVFEIAVERLGRNVYCIQCGRRMTAKPAGVEEALERREAEGRSGGGPDGSSTVERLPFRVLVDNVRSLWNVGSMFRTADAFGVEELILTGITGTPPRREITKTALGAENSVRWTYRADPLAALADLRAAGFVPVALEVAETAVDVNSFPWPGRVALVVGNEVVGVSSPVLEACEHHVRIPMRGVKESLNVAVAFGVAAGAVAACLTSREI